MSSNAILIIVVVFGVSFLSMIPIAIFNKKNKAKKENWVQNSLGEGYAVVCVDAHSFKDNGEKVPKENISGWFYRFAPGEHVLTASLT